MKTKTELIAQFKLENPTLLFGVNDQVFEMDEAQYEATIESWADAVLAKQQAQIDAVNARQVKISAYQKLGLSEAEIEALVPEPTA